MAARGTTAHRLFLNDQNRSVVKLKISRGNIPSAIIEINHEEWGGTIRANHPAIAKDETVIVSSAIKNRERRNVAFLPIFPFCFFPHPGAFVLSQVGETPQHAEIHENEVIWNEKEFVSYFPFAQHVAGSCCNVE